MFNNGWYTEEDILKDLTQTKGRRIKVRLDENHIVQGQRPPPPLAINEDTEEEFLGQGTGGGDFEAPDLSLIKHMLDMVKTEDGTTDVELPETDDTILHISKLNPLTPVFVPQSCSNTVPAPQEQTGTKSISEGETNLNNKITKVRKNKRERNVALNSLLEKYNQEEVQDTDKTKAEEVKKGPCSEKEQRLLTPADFILKEPSIEVSETKVITKPEVKVEKKVEMKFPLPFSANNMFKKKVIDKEKKQEKKESDDSSSVRSSSSQEIYTPTPYAREKYKELMEKSKKKKEEVMIQNYWDGVMQQLKDLDAKKLSEKTPAYHPDLSEDEMKRFEPVLLPSHRHNQDGDCIVCIVRSEHEIKQREDLNKLTLL